MTEANKVATLDISKLEDRDQYAKVIVYGEPGVGKTVFASTAPRPILWLESEGGTNSIADRSQIDVAKVTGLGTYREALKYLQANPGVYQSVVLDSFTETQNAILKEIMRRVVTNDQSRDEFNPLFPEWGRLVGIMREIARGFRDLDMHVCITALQREDKDDMTGRVKIRPRLSPTLADELPGFMDVVGYMYAATSKGGEVATEGAEAVADESVEDVKEPTIVRNMLIKPTGKYVAKVRAPVGSNPPDFLRDPTFADILDVLGIAH
jgi:hypothetical protein